MSPSTSIAVVYDSGSRGNPALRGRTAVLAKAIACGAQSVESAVVTLVHVGERDIPWSALDGADAIVFGCPTYMGSASAAMKAFMEETLRPQFVEQRWKDKLAAGFTNSAGMSGDKLLTLQQLAVFAAQHGMVWISLGLLPGWQDSAGSPDDLNRLSSFLGAMSQSDADRGPDLVPPASDRATAEGFGRRIADAARRWARARRNEPAWKASGAAPRSAGPPPAAPTDDAADAYSRTFEVRWSDVDVNGHMRSTAYGEYALDVRAAWLADAGFGWERLRELGIGPVVLREEIDYRHEVHLGDRVRVDVCGLGLSSDAARFRLRHEIHRGDGELSARVTVEGAWLDLAVRRMVSPPAALAEVLRIVPRAPEFEELPALGTRTGVEHRLPPR